MQLTKPKISFFAEDFSLIKQYLKADEIVEILSALQDLCIFGETNYQPKNSKQQYCWGKLKDEFDKDLTAYQAAVKNGKKGGRPSNKNPEQNPKVKLNETQTESSLTLDTCLPDSCHLSPDTSISAVAPAETITEYVFEGEVIKLKQKEFDDWVKAYPDLNLYAECVVRDGWLSTQPESERKRWFVSTAAYFAKQNEKRKKQHEEDKQLDDVYGDYL